MSDAASAQDVKQSTAPEASEADEMAAALATLENGEAPPADDDKAGEKPPAEGADGETQEAKIEGETDDKPPEGPASGGWSKVLKREKRIAAREKALKESEAKIQARMSEIEERLAQVQQMESEWSGDPVAALAKRGISFDDVARRYLNDGKASPEELARREKEQQGSQTKALEEKLARVERLLEKQNEDRAVGEYKAGVKAVLSDPEFDLLRSDPDAEEEVFALADKWMAKHNEVLQPREAASKLQAEFRKRLSALGSHQAVRSLLLGANSAQSQQAVGGPGQVPRGNGAPGPKTLTNNLAATPSAGEPNLDSLSEEDEIQHALRLL